MCPVLSQALSRMGNEGRVSLRPLHLLGITVEPCQGESESWLVTLGSPRIAACLQKTSWELQRGKHSQGQACNSRVKNGSARMEEKRFKPQWVDLTAFRVPSGTENQGH